jgi:hypothetical protein
MIFERSSADATPDIDTPVLAPGYVRCEAGMHPDHEMRLWCSRLGNCCRSGQPMLSGISVPSRRPMASIS